MGKAWSGLPRSVPRRSVIEKPVELGKASLYSRRKLAFAARPNEPAPVSRVRRLKLASMPRVSIRPMFWRTPLICVMKPLEARRTEAQLSGSPSCAHRASSTVASVAAIALLTLMS